MAGPSRALARPRRARSFSASATFALGAVLYLALDRDPRRRSRPPSPRLPRTEGWYDAALGGLRSAADESTGAVQNGRMTSYLRATFLALRRS